MSICFFFQRARDLTSFFDAVARRRDDIEKGGIGVAVFGARQLVRSRLQRVVAVVVVVGEPVQLIAAIAER